MSAFDEQRETILKEYFELLRFPTIGAEPMRLKDCVDCAMWLKKWLTPQGFAVELMQAPKMLGTPPILLAERKGTEGAPTVLFYGHYDVQPPDPLDAWETPPFEPTLKDNQRVYCRGAQDDKGQFFSFLCGMRKFLSSSASNSVPTIKIVLEGQEESGSTALAALAPTIKDRLRADVLLVCDTSAAADLRPAARAPATSALARAAASSRVFMNAPLPHFTSKTSVPAPSASFLERIEATMSGIEATVPVTSRRA